MNDEQNPGHSMPEFNENDLISVENFMQMIGLKDKYKDPFEQYMFKQKEKKQLIFPLTLGETHRYFHYFLSAMEMAMNGGSNRPLIPVQILHIKKDE